MDIVQEIVHAIMDFILKEHNVQNVQIIVLIVIIHLNAVHVLLDIQRKNKQ